MDNQKWWHKSVIYQIYPRSFYDTNGDGIGDIKGMIEKLDYLEFLGIDMIWICPIYPSPMDDNGYDISDYYNISDTYGSFRDFEQLVEEADRRGIKIMMDLVINHTSDEHQWFIESKKDINNPKRDWYIWKEPKADGSPPNNWRSIFGGSAWEYDEHTNQYYLHTFSKKQPDLNWENEEVRNCLYDMVNWWIEKGVSGFRVDAITFIKKGELTKDLPSVDSDGRSNISNSCLNRKGIEIFLQELKMKTFSNYDIVTVAEAPGVSPENMSSYIGETGHFDMLFEFGHVDLDLDKEGKWYEPKEWNLLELKKAINDSQELLNKAGWGALYIENHDHPRSLNKYLGNVPEENHKKAAKMLATFYFLLKGTPFIFQGQEIGMTNVRYTSIDDYDDLASIDQYHSAIAEGYSKEVALESVWRRSRDNSRTPMQWSATEQAGFTEGTPWLKVNENYKVINVKQDLEDETSIFQYYKKLIELRKHSELSEIIIYGDYEPLLQENENVLAYRRNFQGKTISVIVNFTNKEVSIEGSFENVYLSNYADNSKGFLTNYKLRAYEAIVLQ